MSESETESKSQSICPSLSTSPMFTIDSLSISLTSLSNQMIHLSKSFDFLSTTLEEKMDRLDRQVRQLDSYVAEMERRLIIGESLPPSPPYEIEALLHNPETYVKYQLQSDRKSLIPYSGNNQVSFVTVTMYSYDDLYGGLLSSVAEFYGVKKKQLELRFNYKKEVAEYDHYRGMDQPRHGNRGETWIIMRCDDHAMKYLIQRNQYENAKVHVWFDADGKADEENAIIVPELGPATKDGK